MTAPARERCAWSLGDPLLITYHDQEWGRPVHDDRTLFEFLVLEGAQAGLSWITILRKREAYRAAFDQFDPAEVARYDQKRIERLLQDAGIVRNRAKIESAVKNARAFLKVQEEFGSFARYQWQFVDGKPIVNRPPSMKAVPARTELSDAFSKDLKRRGFSFVGSTIVYAHMQAVGMVDDHIMGCFLCTPASKAAAKPRAAVKVLPAARAAAPARRNASLRRATPSNTATKATASNATASNATAARTTTPKATARKANPTRATAAANTSGKATAAANTSGKKAKARKGTAPARKGKARNPRALRAS